MAKYRLLSLTGSVPVVASAHPPVTSSGDVNIVRSKERKLYNRLLLGTAKMSEVGESGPAGTDPTTLPATTPSWVQTQAGINHAFSLAPLSSSQHEVTSLNCFNSGTTALENTPVPASASMYYSKQNRFVRILYAVTASSNLVIVNSGSTSPTTTDVPGARAHFVAASGNFIFTTTDLPAEIPVFINEYGKIVDIRVWVELISDTRSVQRSLYSNTGIANSIIAIQNPNVLRGDYGRPLLNIPQVRNFVRGVRQSQHQGWGEWVIDNGCYPLWLGGGDGLAAANSASWFSYGTDLDMRTIFTDGSPTRNPYDGTGMPYDSSVDRLNYFFLSSSLPSSQLITQYGPINSLSGSITGTWIPWFVDPNIQGGYLQSVSSSLYTRLGSGSPPPGWLNGPGGTNAVNEFPTTGSQLGPTTIRTPWPLLDDVYSMLVYNTTPDDQPGYYLSNQGILGFRPGLRGKECHGLWKLLIANVNDGCWFRQFRIELVIDQGVPQQFGMPSRSFLYKRKGRPTANRELMFAANAMGLVEQDSQAFYQIMFTGREFCFTIPGPQYGRSVGITSYTGSGDDFSVFTRITGSLARTIGENPNFYLGNEFGTPYIPISSASLSSFNLFSDNDTDAANRAAILDVISSTTDIPADNSLRATLSRTDYFMDMRTRALEALIPQFVPEAPGGTYSNSTRPSAISVPVGTKIYNTDTKQIQSSDGYNWKDSDGNIV